MKKIYVEITNNCNLNCDFCKNTLREKEYMSIENFEKIILQIKDYTNLVCLHVKGEPLLHPKLKEILEVLDKYNLKTNITTNGILLEKNIDILCSSKAVRQLNISLHSSTENENIDISKYMRSIFNSVKKLKDSNIIISYRLWNLKDLSENNTNIQIINKLSEEYAMCNLIENLKINEWIKIDENIFLNQDLEFIWPNMNSKIINEYGKCLAIKEQIAVLVSGDVVPCCIDSEGELKLGNIYNQELKDILNSERSKKILFNFQNNCISEDLCKRCGFLKRLQNKRNTSF